VVTSPQVESINLTISTKHAQASSAEGSFGKSEKLIVHGGQRAKGAEAKFAGFGELQVSSNENGVHVL
jgi:hypothetical protein